MNYNLCKIIFFTIILVIVFGFLTKEKFVNITPLINDKKYDIIKVDTMANKLVKQTHTDKILEKKINDNMIDIFEEIQNNIKLKDYLKSINLIDNDGYPIFINESKDIVLFNMIKIQLILMKNIQNKNV